MSGHELPVIPRPARAFQGEAAGLVTRAIAAIIDVLVAIVALVAAYLAVAGISFLLDPRGFSFPDPHDGLAVSTVSVVLAGYWTIAWATVGRSFGNALMGLRVVTTGGGRIGWMRSALRAIACVLFPILLLWAAVDRRGRSVQDLVLHTRVIYDWLPQPARIRPPAGR